MGLILEVSKAVTGDLSLGMTFAPTSTSSAIVNGLRIAPTINVGAAVSWTGSATMLLVNPTLTATGSGSPVINLMDLQVGGVSRFTVNQNGHINNSTTDVSGSVSSAPTGIVATNVVVAVGAATATFTVSSTEGFTVGDTVTASASGVDCGFRHCIFDRNGNIRYEHDYDGAYSCHRRALGCRDVYRPDRHTCSNRRHFCIRDIRNGVYKHSVCRSDSH